MYYTLSYDPQLGAELSELIGAIRKAHDPTFAFSKPHITVLFPVPGSVGEERLIGHIQSVLDDCEPFDIRLEGFHKSRDHWLFLTLTEGEAQLQSLYQTLYTGILSDYRSDDKEYVPHIGLGLFLKEGATYNWNDPQEVDCDRERYEDALRQATALPLPISMPVDELRMSSLPDELLEWATGRRASIPEDSHIAVVRKFRL